MIGLRRGVVGKTVDPNLKLELKFNSQVFTDVAGTVAAGTNDYVRAWRSTVGGHLLTQATDAARPQRVSDGIYFDGGDYISAPFVLATRSPWTIELWEYDSSGADASIVAFQPDNRLYLQWANSSTFFLGDSASNVIVGGVTRPIGEWYHLVAQFDGTIYKIWKNGVFQTSTSTAMISMTSTSVVLGHLQGFSRYFDGKMTDIRIYNVAKYTANFTPPTRSA